MSDTIYIVTGAAGHLGGFVVARLLQEGRKVRAFVLPTESCGIDPAEKNFSEYYGDICDSSSMEPVFNVPEGCSVCVIHCAGIVSIYGKDDPKVYKVNVGGTGNVVEVCKKHRVKRLVYVSSVHALPELPPGECATEVKRFDFHRLRGCYAKTKAEASQLVMDAVAEGLDAVVVHPAGIIGPSERPNGNVAHLVVRFLGGKLPAGVRGGFDFVDVRDVAQGIIAAADKGRKGECYILSNRFIRLEEFFDTLSEVSGAKKLKVFLPIWFAKIATPFTELYYKLAKKTPLFTAYSLDTLKQNALYSHEKADKELGYSTRSLKETMADTVTKVKSSRLFTPKQGKKRPACRCCIRSDRRDPGGMGAQA